MSGAEAPRPSPDIPKTPPDQNTYESNAQLAIVARYEQFADYIYPIWMGMPRAHYVLRDRAVGALLDQVGLFTQAGKSGLASRLYAADAGLAALRFYLRFCADSRRKLISPHQHQVAAIHLADTGRMLGAWIRRVQHGGAKR